MISFDTPQHVVLITGATGGIGQEFCKQFARRGYPLALSGRNAENLQQLAETLNRTYRVGTYVFPVDLSSTNGPVELLQAVKNAGLTVEILVNNAGALRNESLQEATVSGNLGMLTVNVQALTNLTTLALQDMLRKGHGHIINVSSTAGWIAMPEQAVYAASKTYVRQLTLATANELKARNAPVGITALCPNWADTKMMDNPVQGKRLRVPRWLYTSPAKVAKVGVEAAFNNKPLAIPGRVWAVSMALVQLLPMRVPTAAFGWFYRKVAEDPQVQ